MTQLVKLLIAILTLFIPVNKRLVLCGSWLGNRYGDNARYLYEWLNEHPQGVTAVWVTKNTAVAKTLASKGLPVTMERSWTSFWLHLRASAVVCNTSQDSDLWGVMLNRKVKVFNLWHGTPIKKIGFDALASDIAPEKMGVKKHKNFKRVLPIALFQRLKSFVDKKTYFLASSQAVSQLLQSAMAVSKDQILISGYPKLDHLIKAAKNVGNGHILYAPTYRGEYNSENDLLSEFEFKLEDVESWLAEFDKQLTIRLHPANTLPNELIDRLNQSSRVHVGQGGDLYESLIDFELVITDFSSLYYDCLAINVPVMLAPFGLASYISQDRALYFSPEELYPGHLVYDWPSLISELPNVYTHPVDLSTVKEKFYTEKAGESSPIIWQKMSRIINS